LSTSERYLRLTALGQRAFYKARLERSLRLFTAAEHEAARAGDRELQDRAFCNRCVVLIELDRPDSALGELKHVLMRSRDPFTSWMAAYYTAQVYEFEENFPRALAYARRASELAEASGDTRSLSLSANQQGALALRDSQFVEASECFGRALELASEALAADPIAAAIMRDNLGYCLMCTGKVDEGLSLCRDAAASLESVGSRQFLPEVYMDLCYGALEEGRNADACEVGERALALAKEFANDSVERNTLMLLADAALDGEDESAADAYLGRLARHYPDFRGMKTFMRTFNVRKVINLKV
jgi:tetratricopeptide (TPR) repeat protein